MADEKSTDLSVRSHRDSFTMRYEPRDFDEMSRLAQAVVRSGLAPRDIRKPEDAMIILMTGRELGLTAMQSLRSINVIQGRPSLSADLMVALVRRSNLCEYFSLVELTDQHCVYETKHRHSRSPVTYTFTLEDARRANLINKDMWRKYPKNMLRARCASNLARAVYPELMTGVYDPDELSDDLPPRPQPQQSQPSPEPGEAYILDAEFEAVEGEPEEPQEPIIWPESDQAERWHAASKRLHALIAECGLNGAASRAVRESLKTAKGVESYKHLAPAYLEANCTRLAAQSPHDGEHGEMSPRMATILRVTGMTPDEATADVAAVAAATLPSVHEELRELASESVLEEDLEKFFAALAHITGAKSFADVSEKAAARYVEMLRGREPEALPGTPAGTLSPRAAYIQSLIEHYENDLRST